MRFGKTLPLVGSGFVVVVLLVLFFFFDDIREEILPVFEWIEARGAWGAFWFILIYVGLVVLLIPSLPLTLAGGFLFGVVHGSAYVIAAMMIGALTAFAIARYFLHGPVASRMERHPTLERVSRGMGPDGWKIVMLCRFIPFFPAKLSNYLFGVTHIRLPGFILGNFLGILPYTILNVWIGSLAADLATLGEREQRTPLEWGLYGLGFVATIAVVVYITRLARGAMEKTLERAERREEVRAREAPESSK
jgi:uncharacterized membrane protein YdjX (TVP38/TMEM64 family)